ncbi:inosine guanosine and [Choiromyces venosus 120613-1]|uniref:Purine nucleoside phosphorylase n=1 Tax=Choiromyces venosus 120613-1 TaxID=1336337 RepID=A0A3N4JU25_9PEZI|nr:inosine guanosine and [Choiromyces venosus 120613-1]
MSESIYAQATESANYVRNLLPEKLKKPDVGVICGSGLGGLAGMLDQELLFELSYKDIPHFPHSTVVGHAGKFVFGFLGEKKTPVVVMVGRVHYFEGHSIQKVTFPTRVMKLLGIHTIVVTNAAGGLNTGFSVGDIMVLNDHINFPGLAGQHPLWGPNEEKFGTRFPALSEAYDLSLRKQIHLSYKKLQLTSEKRKLHEGVYVFVSGPTSSFETRAECRLLRALGADVVGMSTVPEVIVARHCGIRVLAMSLVTNCAVLEPGPRGDSMLVEEMGEEVLKGVLESGAANHEEVLETGAAAARDLQGLVRQFIDDIAP